MQKESKKTFQAWLRKRLGRKKTPKFYRGQEKFRNRYPDYEVGVGTYGLPKVHDWQEGTTLRVGAYTSIADDVHIFLGGHHRVDWISSYPFSRLFLRKPVISATLAAVAAMSESATMCGWRRERLLRGTYQLMRSSQAIRPRLFVTVLTRKPVMR